MSTDVNDHESERISLFFSCRHLKKTESQNNKEFMVQLKTLVSKDVWLTLGHTESIKSDSSLDFATTFNLNFVFEIRQKLKAELMEVNKSETGKTIIVNKLNRQQSVNDNNGISHTRTNINGVILGECNFELADLAGSIDNSKVMPLRSFDGKNYGNCIARMEKLTDKEKFSFGFDLIVFEVPKFHMFSSQNSYVKIFKQKIPDGQLKKMIDMDQSVSQFKNFEWALVDQTTPVAGPLIRYPGLYFNGSKLCYNNRQILLKFELWKSKKNRKDYLLGKTELTLNDITLSQNKSFKLTLLEKPNTKTILKFEKFKSERVYDFLDFIHGGIHIKFVVGIDFTLSNKDHNNKDSLHFYDGKTPNLYQRAIMSVGEILEKYNTSKQIAAYGFGAKIEPNAPASHFFPINLNYANPFFGHFREMLEAYCSILDKISFSGPTNFAPLLEKVLEFADLNFKADPYSYTVLLLMTDGEVTDLQETIDCIIKGCALPLSVVIVGIGNESFTKMDQLDGNDEPLVSSDGNKMTRDIVRFVSFNNFANNPVLLREEVLRELPDQVVEFYKLKGITPGTKKTATGEDYYRINTMNETDSKNNTSFPSIDQMIEQGFFNR